MFASFLYLLLGSLLGFTILRSSRSPLTLGSQVLWGIPLGIILLACWTFLWAVVVKVQDWAVVGSCVSAAVFIFYYFNQDAHRQTIQKEWSSYWKNATHKAVTKDVIAWAVVLLPWLIYTAITIPRLLFFEDGNLTAGWINVWGDWAVHLRNSTFLAASDTLRLENPLYAGTDFHYPYLSSYLSALLQRFGLSVELSLIWPTIVLFATLPAVLYSIGRKLTNSRLAGVLFVYIVLLAGGMGVIYLLQDLLDGKYFWQASSYSPLLYTDYRLNGSYFNGGIWFMNFIISEFIPQRAFLAGIPLALYVLYISWLSLFGETSVHPTPLPARLTAGLIFGLLPLIHTHSFIALGIIIPVLVVWRAVSDLRQQPFVVIFKKYWPIALSILGPATLLGFTLLFLFVFDPQATGSFVHRITWWMPNQDQPLDNPILYWLRNAGPLILLGLTSFFWQGKLFRPLLAAGAVLWLLCNFLSFQPWHYDNLKIMTYWYILWAIPVALVVATAFRKVPIFAIIAVILLTGAGLTDTISVLVSTQQGIGLASKQDVAFAEKVRLTTSHNPDALFVAATNHDNPLSLLSGRRLYVGYEGWLWTYGIVANERIEEVKEMYKATDKGLALIKERGVNYMAIGPQERQAYQPNEARLRSLFPVVVQQGNYLLLRAQ